MSQSRIPGWLFMLVGVAVIFYSSFIERRSGDNLIFFTIVGWLFLLYGLGNEALPRIRARSPPKKEPPRKPPIREHDHDHRHPAGNQYHGKSPHEHHAHTRPQGHQHTSHPHTPPHKACPRCHATNSLHRKLCHACSYEFY